MKSASSMIRFLSLLGCPWLALAACSSDATPPAASSTATPAPVTPTPPVLAPGDLPVDQTVDRGTTPPGPTSNDPKDYPGLKIESLKAGDGKEALAGKRVKVRYIGTLLNGREFDSSWKRGAEPTEFALAEVVPGFRVGLLGMKTGERRRVTIPGQFGYQEAGSPGAGIGPNETLIFDVELVDVID